MPRYLTLFNRGTRGRRGDIHMERCGRNAYKDATESWVETSGGVAPHICVCMIVSFALSPQQQGTGPEIFTPFRDNTAVIVKEIALLKLNLASTLLPLETFSPTVICLQ